MLTLKGQYICTERLNYFIVVHLYLIMLHYSRTFFLCEQFFMIKFDEILRYLYLVVWSTTMTICRRIAFIFCSVLEMYIACNSGKQNSCLAAVSVLS